MEWRLARVGALLWGLAATAHGAPLAGDPPYTRLTPDIEFYPQNFAIAQDASGQIYVGNSEGVLIHDGARWRLLALPGGDHARSLAWDRAGRVYVGGFDQFGYIEYDAAGQPVYHDLAAAFAALLGGETFADVWDVHIAPQGVFFRALRHLFLYDPDGGAVRLWRHAGRFGEIAEHEGRVIVQFRGEGFRQLVGDDWQPLPGSAALTELVFGLVPLPQGGLLTLAADGQWRVLGNGALRAAPMPAGFPPSSSISSAVALADGTLALASDEGLVFFLDPRSGAFRRFRLERGYLNEIILARDGGLLVVGDENVYRIEWPAAWTVLDARHGLSGNLHETVRWGANWFALTGAGVQELAAQADGALLFEPREWTFGEAWDLLPLDAGNALLAESYAVKHVTRAGAARAVTHNALYPRLLRRSRFDADVVLAGLEPGFAVLRREGGQWRLALEQSDMHNVRVLTLVEAARGEVWIGSERGGIWRLQLSPDYRRLTEARRFGAAEGLEYDATNGGSVTALPDGSLVAGTARGFYRWTGERFVQDELGGLDALRPADEWLDLAVAPDGTRWAYTFKHVFRETADGWRREELAGVSRAAVGSVRFDDGRAVLSADDSVLIFNAAAAGRRSAPARPLLQAAELGTPGGERRLLPLAAAAARELPQDNFTLTFRYALPDYRRPEAVRYATRLAGLEPEFSDWSDVPQVSYARLPAGEYRLELRARDGSGQISEIEPLTFRVTPRWYLGAWAQALWVLLALTLLAALTQAVVGLRTRRLAADKARLEGLVAQRTAELEAVNRRLQTMALNDGLTGVANRRRLDAYLDEAWSRCAAQDRPLSLLAIDVDRFKSYNDQHGHLNGDELLMLLVHGLSRLTGEAGLLGRYGGDEFMAVLPGMDAATAQRLAESMRGEAEAMQLGTTVSIGVATGRPATGAPTAQLLAAADQALYAAKAGGRNRVDVAT